MSVRVAVLLLAASANARSLPQPTLTASAGGAARKDEHPLIRPVSGGLASCTAEICTLPIDRTKVMMQIATDSKGLVGTMRNVIEKEGAGALFKGAKPALLRQASYQSIKMALYEPIRDAVMRATSDDPNADPTLWQMILAGGIAGAVGTFLTSPTDLVKVRMQSGASYDSVSAAFADVYKDGGLTGLWAGWVPNCQRSFIVNAAELATCAARPPARPAPPRRRRPTTASPARARRPMRSQVRLLQAAAAEARAVRRAALPNARLLRRRLRRRGGVDARRPREDAADDARRRVRRQHGQLPRQDRTGRRARRAVPRLPRDVDADRAVGLPLLRLLRAVPQRAQRPAGAPRKAEGQVESGEWAARARHATPALARVCCRRGDFYTPNLGS